MLRFVLSATVAVLLVEAIPERASADIMLYESLDLAVMRSDLVIRGEVIEIVSKKGDNAVILHQVTVQVKETLKGEKLEKVQFLVREAPFGPQAIACRNMRDEVLFCLNALDRPKGESGPSFVLHSGNIPWAVLLNGAPGTGGPIYSLDFKPLTDPKEILKAARAAVGDKARKPGATLERIVQGDLLKDAERPYALLYPDSARVRAAAKLLDVKMLPYDK